MSPLSSLVAATQQDDQSVSDAPEIDSITWPNVDPKLLHTVADRFAVTEQSSPDTANAKQDRRYRTPVVQ